MASRKLKLISFILILVFIFSSIGGTTAFANSDQSQSIQRGEGYKEATSLGGGAQVDNAVAPIPVNASSLPQIAKPESQGEAVPVPMGEPLDEKRSEGSSTAESVSSGSQTKDLSGNMPNVPSELGDWEGPDINDSGLIPPDPIIAAGPQHVVVNVNSLIRVYDRNGNQVSSNSASSWYSSVLPTGTFVFDPRILYDRDIGRFIMVWVATKTSTNEAWFLVSCSQSSDPTGSWYNYALDATLNGTNPTNNWADYPRVGVTNRAITLSANMLEFGGDFQYTKVRILDKVAVCDGNSLVWWDQWGLKNIDGTETFTIVPAQQYGYYDEQYMINAENGDDSDLTLWKVVDPLDTANGPTFLQTNPVGVSPFQVPPNAKQPGTSQDLDNTGTRMLHAVVQDDMMWATQTDACDWGSGDRSCLRHYRIGSVTSYPYVDDSTSYGSSGYDYFYPSISVDSVGNAVISFARSGDSEYASARYAELKAGSSIGTSASCADGVAEYEVLDSFGRNRWGDYTGVEIAPDLSTFYVFNEYVGATDDWYTRVCVVRFKMRAITDFLYDGSTDVAVYRPSNGNWYIKGQSSVSWGKSGDMPVPGDYDGDGDFDIAVLRPSNGKWYIKGQSNVSWFKSGDVPVQADYDGDGTTDIAVLRPSNGRWYILGMGNFNYFRPGDVPVPCDYNGDGEDEIAVFRPSNGNWYVRGMGSVSWGFPDDIPVPGDYDGDAVCDMAVYRPFNGNWYIRGQGRISWGNTGDIPAPGDFDGDGETEVAVVRPGNGRWYIKGIGNVSWFKNGDFPLNVRDTNADGDPHH